MAALSVCGVSKRFGAVEVLRDVSLEMQSGEFVALLGASGSGKSTLLRIVAGLEAPNAGAVAIGGRDVTTDPPDRRDLAMVFQTYALYPQMTVAQNIALPLEMRRLAPWQRWPGAGWLPQVRRARACIAEEAARAAAAVGLEKHLERRPAQLSGGQRQRAALARAMVRRPRLLLMDEPLSNLDAKLRQKMRGEIADLHRATQATILYVTHDQVEALTLADRVAVMVDGRIVQMGPPDVLYSDPDRVEVAELLGSPAINLVDGTAAAGGVQAGGQRWACAVPVRAGAVRLGFRPEAAEIGPATANAPAAEVRRVELVGGERLVYLAFPDGQEAVVRQPLRARWAVGDRATVHVAPGDLLLFGADGARIRGDSGA